jgi:Tol biopolymer transport system component
LRRFQLLWTGPRPARGHFAAVLLGLVALSLGPAGAEQQHGAERSRPPVTIEVPDFAAGNPADAEVAREIAGLIDTELKRRGSLAPLSAADGQGKPQARIDGRIDRQDDRRLRIRVRLFDAIGGWHITSREYTIRPDQWRDVAHEIAGLIEDSLTGRPPRTPDTRN